MSGKQKQNRKTISITKPFRERDVWFYPALFFIIAFSYFFWFANHILFFQEQQNLFVYLSSFLGDSLVKPGGPLDLAGKFLTQFYASKFAGSLILAVILTLPAVILIRVNKKMIKESVLSQLLMIIPSCLLLIMQMHYYHFMTYNLGFLLVLLFFLLSVSFEKKVIRYVLFAIYPVFYYVAGAYALIFLFAYISYNLIYIKSARKYFDPLIFLFLALISVTLSREVFFNQPAKQFLLYPLPSIDDSIHKSLFFILTGYLILYSVLCRTAGSIKLMWLSTRLAGIITAIIVFSFTVSVLVTRYNSQTSRVINLEKLVFEERWNDVISYQEKYPSGNLIGQYFYNIALSETGQLCDRLFYGHQDFGTGSLMLNWSSDYLNWGSFAFYTTGLANEAQRWVFEEMVVYGCRPQNMHLLVKTSLLTGHYRMAEKYAGILKHTLFYKSWAEKYSTMARDTSLILSDPELGKKVKSLPRNDFFVSLESPEDNLPVLFDENRSRKEAFEYMMAWLLLEKDVETLVSNVKLMKNLGYTHIPRHIEEAIMIYYNSQNVLPDLGGLQISNDTRIRFGQYFTNYVSARENPAMMQETMRKKFGNTFWYFFHFGQTPVKQKNN